MNDAKKIHTALLTWYSQEKRPLPWRKNKDPYRIWISEIMLQQTRVEAVIPYFERFLSHFPTIQDLANASEDQVTNLWAGLGYYSRARNLRKAAQEIGERFAGKMPTQKEELKSLPGIGDYTSSAIASIAFDQNHIALDGNLERVLARLLGEKKDPKKEGRPAIQKFGDALASFGQAGNINQAIMDLSSSTCLPKNPSCKKCPLTKFCEAKKKNLWAKIPFKKKKEASIELKSHGWILIYDSEKKPKEVLIARRKKGSWLAGMWDLPWWLEEEENHEAPPSWRRGKKIRTKRAITKYDLHFDLSLFFTNKKPSLESLSKQLHAAGSEFRWCTLEQLEGINLPRPSEKALAQALSALN